MSKELKALEIIKSVAERIHFNREHKLGKVDEQWIINNIYCNTTIIEKSLKALEIIKDMNKIVQEHIKGGEIIICCETKNDFDLLKEVLL